MSKEIFLSHAWGNDELGRNNHSRVKILYELLLSRGYSVWLDEYNMVGNIDNAIIKGISNCQVVIICLTENYCNKINTCVYENLSNDNCYKEWNFCLFKQKKIIPVIMEPKMEEIFLRTDGVIQMYLNNQMYINFSSDNEDENDLFILYKTLRQFEVYTRNEKQFMNIRPNNSFDKFKDLLQLSPKNKKLSSPSKVKNLKDLDILTPNDSKWSNFINKFFIKITYTRPKLRTQKSKIFKPKINNQKIQI